jgi:hypothetical protein
VTFLSPLFLAGGAAAAGAIVLLHFLARRRPRPAVLPTARFVPDDPARWPSRAPRPTDWLLLALRVLAVVMIATAFAQPVRESERVATTRVVLVDRSHAIGDERAMRDSAMSALREGDVMIPFDTSAIMHAQRSRDSAATLARSSALPSFTTALIAAERAALDLRESADSLELVLISSFADAAWDAATPELRARWPGRVRLIHVPLAAGDTSPSTLDVRAAASDPVRAAVTWFASEGEATVRIVRGALLESDSAWVRAGHRVLLHWPIATGDAAPSAQAVVAGDVVLAAPLVRRTLAPREGGSVIARFADGSPAVVEQTYGAGCLREVAFDFPRAGDVPLRESSRRVAALLAGRCQQHATYAAMDSARLDSLRGEGGLLATSSLPRPPQRRSTATAWLLIIAALLLLAEVAVRRRVPAT